MSSEFVVEPIGVVESAITDVAAAPRQPDEGAPQATLVLDERVHRAMEGLAAGDRIIVLTWLHRADRDVLRTRPRSDANRPLQGVFATRSPDRPNPVGMHPATIVAIDGSRILVDQLEAIDGTPIIDIKPVIGDPSDR